jgi:hypothetical protein
MREHLSSLRGDIRPDASAIFVERMMEQPMLIGTTLGGNPRFTDPLALADRLLELRVSHLQKIEALPAKLAFYLNNNTAHHFSTSSEPRWAVLPRPTRLSYLL